LCFNVNLAHVCKVLQQVNSFIYGSLPVGYHPPLQNLVKNESLDQSKKLVC